MKSWYDLVQRHAARKTYLTNEVIHYQGQPIECVSLVLSGELEAVSYSEDGGEAWIEGYIEGNFIGHLAFLGDVPSHYEIMAKSNATLLQLSASKTRELLSENLALREAFTQDFAQHLNVVTMSLVGAYNLSARGRICAELARLSSEIGIEPDKSIIRPNPVYVELARRVNSTRETVSRTVSVLQKKGILARVPGALLVLQPDKLATALR